MTRSPAVARVADHAAYMQRPSSNLRLWMWKESDFPEWLQSHTHYGDCCIKR